MALASETELLQLVADCEEPESELDCNRPEDQKLTDEFHDEFEVFLAEGKTPLN